MGVLVRVLVGDSLECLDLLAVKVGVLVAVGARQKKV